MLDGGGLVAGGGGGGGELGEQGGIGEGSRPKTNRRQEKRRRNRVAVSCYTCRALKTKCDGVRPTCATCAHSGRSCTYLQQGISGSGAAAETVVVSRQYLRNLEQRLETLERRGSVMISAGSLSSAREPPEVRDEQLHPASFSCSSEKQAPITDGQPPYDGSHEDEDSPASVIADANVSLGGVAFAQLILNTLHGDDVVKAQSMSTDNEVREEPSQIQEDDLDSIPANAAELLDQFFNFRHPLSPVFHVPTVRPLLDRALRCHPDERLNTYKPTMIILNMIFAICTSHWLIVSEDTVANHRAARRHYDIAMRLMQPNLLRDWRLEHVQALLIGARYLQCSSCADECWNVLGLAIRIAYGLCLHREPPDTDPPPVRETKRRVWYAAYTLDRLMSMVYERPSAIRSAECSVLLPEDLDDDCIRMDGMLYPMPRRPTAMTFSIEVIKLYRIMESLMTGLTGDVHSNRDMVQLLSSLHERYRRWHRALPACLVLDHNNPREQPWILALRANMVRILIHRQSLAMTLHGLAVPQEADDVILQKAQQRSRDICTSAAVETVDIVALRHEETRKTLGRNWFNIYYLFNAVIVLLSHLVDPQHSKDPVALSKVELALQMIQSMSHNHAFAARAHSFLKRVLDYAYQSATQRDGHRDEAMAGDMVSAPGPELLMAVQDDHTAMSNLHTYLAPPDDINGGLDFFQGFGMFEVRDHPLAPWSFNDQWFH